MKDYKSAYKYQNRVFKTKHELYHREKADDILSPYNFIIEVKDDEFDKVLNCLKSITIIKIPDNSINILRNKNEIYDFYLRNGVLEEIERFSTYWRMYDLRSHLKRINASELFKMARKLKIKKLL